MSRSRSRELFLVRPVLALPSGSNPETSIESTKDSQRMLRDRDFSGRYKPREIEISQSGLPFVRTMFCSQCGKELPPGAPTCPACGAPVPPAPASPSQPTPQSTGSSPSTVDQMVAEVKQAAKELIQVSARISRYAVDHAEAAGKDPSGTVKKAAKRVAKELDDAAREVERVLRDL
jgi:zinc ribbon protein